MEVTAFSVYEDALSTDAIGSVVARDLDANDILKYTLASEFDGAIFDIALTTGVITLASTATLDYETRQIYKVTVIVRDHFGVGPSAIKGTFRGGEARHTFSISVLNANDKPVFPAVGIELQMNENSVSNGRTLTDFMANDVDNGGAPLTYTITAVNQEDGTAPGVAPAAGLFKLIVDSGKTYVAVDSLVRTLDFENPDAGLRFKLTVTATDAGITDPGGCGTHCLSKTGTGVVYVNIVDVNEPPSLKTASLAAAVKENTDLDENVKKLLYLDPDAQDQATGQVQFFVHRTRAFSTSNGCNPGGSYISNKLSITSSGQLQSREAIDYETGGLGGKPLEKFCVEIRVVDSGGLDNEQGSTGKYQSVTVAVEDVNEPPELPADQIFTVAESKTSGVVGSISVVDPDAADQNVGDLKVVIVSGSEYNGSPVFEVAAAGTPGAASTTSFDLSMAAGATLNYELNSRYELALNVTDSAGNAVQGDVVVSLTDVDEKPVFKDLPITMKISKHSTRQTGLCTAATYCAPGTIVGEIRGFDEDIVDGVNEAITFAIITSSNTDNAFELVKTTDESATLKVKTVTARIKTKGTLTLQVTATGKRGVASAPQDVTVEVVDVNYVPTFTATTFNTITEDEMKTAFDTSTTLAFGPFKVADPDDDYDLTLTIKATDPPGFTESFDIVAGATKSDWILNLAHQGTLNYENILGKATGAAQGKICLTVQADDAAGATSVYEDYCVQVGDSPERPAMPPAYFEVRENEAVLLVGQMYAKDEDAADQPQLGGGALTYAIDPPVEGFSLTTVTCNTDAAMGQRCAKLALTKALDYETLKDTYGAAYDVEQGRITINVKVTDSKPFVVTTPIYVTVVDVNESPVINGDGSPLSMNIDESAVAGTALGSPILTTDPDSVTRNLAYSLEGADASYFAVAEKREGRQTFALLSLNGTSNGGIDFEDRTTFQVTLKVDDGGNANIAEGAKTGTATVNLKVQNINDVTVSSVKHLLANGNLAGDIGHSTNGGDRVRITGTNFGPTTRKTNDVNEISKAPTLVVTYGGDSGHTDFNATNCVVTVLNTEIECKTAVFDRQVRGTGLKWVLTSDGDKSVESSDTTRYTPPTVTGAVVQSGKLDTKGGGKVLISGKNFGKAGGMSPFETTALGQMSFSYSFLKSAVLVGANCVVKAPLVDGTEFMDQLECVTGEGTGSTLQFQVTVGGQKSNVFQSTAGYAPPSVTTVVGGSGVDIQNLLTTGQQTVVIRGENFGPLGTDVGGTYGGYESTCTVTNAHVEMQCKTVSGSGLDQEWRVYVKTGDTDQQWSLLNGCPTCVTSYHPPIITNIGGANIKDLRTEGGQEILIVGNHFGAATISTDCNDGTPRPTIAYGNPTGGASVALFNTTTQLQGGCCKVLSPTLVSCLSGPGVGRGHSYEITVSKQKSNILPTTGGTDQPTDSGYGPPVLVLYSGQGAQNGNTEGNEDVVIEGRNFGPASIGGTTGGLRGALTQVTYGLATEGPGSKKSGKYTVPLAQCEITTDHFFVTCKNLPGAGKGMKWVIMVDGQESITPSTNYGRPEITEIKGPASGILNTNGQEEIRLIGTNFGPDPITSVSKKSPITGNNFLQSVTYGPNGFHYKAGGYGKDGLECKITKSSTEITCKTAPGVGSKLQWIVTVEGQTSPPFTYAGYEPPKINDITPKSGPTAGEIQVKLTGRGFGLRDPTSSLSVTFGDTQVDMYGSGASDDLNAGDTGYFSLPERFGKDIDVFVTVTTPAGVSMSSNKVAFSYDPPKIDLLTTKWADPAKGLLAITATGSNFCSGTNGCGTLYIDGTAASDITSWTHTDVVVNTALDEGQVSIQVGSGLQMQVSESWSFAHLSPAISEDTILDLSKRDYGTKGGEEVSILGYFFGSERSVLRVTVGGDGGGKGGVEATIQSFAPGQKISDGDRLIIKLPAGQGKDQPLIVWRGKQPSQAAALSYSAPNILSIEDDKGATVAAGAPVSPTTGGTKLVVKGTNFGISSVIKLSYGNVTTEVAVVTQTHVELSFTVPSGQGKDLAVAVKAGNQQSGSAGNSNPTISYNMPTIGGYVLNGAAGRRRRGMRALLVASPAPSASTAPAPSSASAAPAPSAAEPVVQTVTCATPTSTPASPPAPPLKAQPTLGGTCITLVGTNLGNIVPKITFGSELANIQARDTVGHTWIVFQLPPGEGGGLTVTVQIGNQVATDTFSYEKPVVTSVSPLSGPTSGINSLGQPIVMTIIGNNFGRPSASGVREVRITPPPAPGTAASGATATPPFVIKVSTFLEETHSKLVFYMPEGYGQKDTVEVAVANQAGTSATKFDYTIPTITSVTPYCGAKYKCRAPAGQFDTDGCSDLLLWEDYTDWQGRRNSALKTILNSDFDRKCGYDNDRWQMAIIEGTSLGSYALAQSEAPLRVAVSRPDQKEDFPLPTSKAGKCAECIHTHTRIIARSAWGYGRNLNLTVALGASVSNPFPWSYKAPEIRSINSASSNVISANGAGEIVLRGRNFGKTTDPAKMVVRVFIGYDYNVRGEAIGYQDNAGTLIDLAGQKSWTRELVADINMNGRGMKECFTMVTDETTGDTNKLRARWHSSYNYSIPGARNVDGFPYIACTPQKDVSGPKNVTIILGAQIDSCATNYRLCADPISFQDRRMRKPAEYCERQKLLEAQGGSNAGNASTNATADSSECRDDSFCTWDCFSNSLFVGQCVAETGSTTASYAKTGQLCADVSDDQAKCDDDDCMSLNAKAGFFRLTVDINCSKPSPDQPCNLDEQGVVQWNRPEEAKRAMGTNTEAKKPRCPVERWEPLVPVSLRYSSQSVDEYKQYEGIQLPTECFDVVSCQPRKACNGSNVCNENGYEYTLKTCKYFMSKIDNASLACVSDDECRSMDKKGKFYSPGMMDSDGKVRVGQAPSTEPQSQSRCIKRQDPLTNKVTGRCECYTSPRCSLCTVGSNWISPGINEGDEYFVEGYFRLNGKCAECPKNPGLLIGCFLGGIVLLGIGFWYLNKKNFNVAFISIGFDYFQVLALFSRAEIEWPALMRSLFDFFSAFNFNIDITAPECLIPNMDYRVKWIFNELLPVASFAFLCVAFLCKIVAAKIAGKQDVKICRKFSKIIAQFLLLLYFFYLSVTRRALDVFNCNPSVPSDGYLYTEFTSIDCEGGHCKCWQSGSTQVGLVPWAIACLCVYTAGFPLFVAYIVTYNKKLIKEDQMLRAYGLSPTRKTNQKVYEIRKRYHKMYYHFKPGKIYWIVYIITRKFLIAFIGLMFRQNPGFQLALCLLVLFGCYILQVKNRPFMSNSERDAVVAEHQAKVQMYHDQKAQGQALKDIRPEFRLHYQMAAHIKAAQHANGLKTNGKKKSRVGRKSIAGKNLDWAITESDTEPLSKKDAKKAQKKQQKDAKKQSKESDTTRRNYYFDYNTVEATLLGCAVLVCLSGVMFENERFKNRDDVLYEKEIMTYAVFLIIFGSVIYYGIVFCAEVLGYTPKWIMKCFASRRSRQEQANKKGVGVDLDADVEMANMNTNPMGNNVVR